MFRRFAYFAARVARRLFKSPPPERPYAGVLVPVLGGSPKPRAGAIALEEPKGVEFSDLRSKWKVF